MTVALRPFNGLFLFETGFALRPMPAPVPAPPKARDKEVEEPVLELDEDGEDEDEVVADPNRPRGWLVSEREFERVFDPARGRFEDVPKRRRAPGTMPSLFGC